MENIPTMMEVAAVAFARDKGLWLLHRRPIDKHHGGLWEFPGGKRESDEALENTAIREAREELGVEIRSRDIEYVCRAQSESENALPAIVITLYICRKWIGEPQALEGGDVGWFTQDQALALNKPPLDVLLCNQLFGAR